TAIEDLADHRGLQAAELRMAESAPQHLPRALQRVDVRFGELRAHGRVYGGESGEMRCGMGPARPPTRCIPRADFGRHTTAAPWEPAYASALYGWGSCRSRRLTEEMHKDGSHGQGMPL